MDRWRPIVLAALLALGCSQSQEDRLARIDNEISSIKFSIRVVEADRIRRHGENLATRYLFPELASNTAELESALQAADRALLSTYNARLEKLQEERLLITARPLEEIAPNWQAKAPCKRTDWATIKKEFVAAYRPSAEELESAQWQFFVDCIAPSVPTVDLDEARAAFLKQNN